MTDPLHAQKVSRELSVKTLPWTMLEEIIIEV
jgi:hypothetical protein